MCTQCCGFERICRLRNTVQRRKHTTSQDVEQYPRPGQRSACPREIGGQSCIDISQCSVEAAELLADSSDGKQGIRAPQNSRIVRDSTCSGEY